MINILIGKKIDPNMYYIKIFIIMILIYSIDGNIGSGKSTIVDNLKEKFFDRYLENEKVEFVFIDEPVDIWEEIKDESGENILQKFYKDQEKYSFSFQMMAYISRLHKLKSVIDKSKKKVTVIITERSVFTDYEIFAKMLYNDGKIETINFTIYKMWFSEFIKDIPFKGVIYIKTDPALCSERISIRNRQGENISLDYLEKCHEYHERWINKLSESSKLVIDGNKDKDNSLTSNINQIMEYLKNELLNSCGLVIQFSPSRSMSDDSF